MRLRGQLIDASGVTRALARARRTSKVELRLAVVCRRFGLTKGSVQRSICIEVIDMGRTSLD
jgi:hypothetical protein